MRCKNCSERVAIHDLWCLKCGHRTSIISKDLSVIESLNFSWRKYKLDKGKNLPVGIWGSLLSVIPALLLIIGFYFFSQESYSWIVVVIRNIIWLLFIPMLFIPFNSVCKKEGYHLTVKDYFSGFSLYPKYLFLSLLNVIYYLLIYYLCKGDPILNLVWLVLVLYWIPIILPVPILMERYNLSVINAIVLSYKKASDLRWNLFLLAIMVFLSLILSVVMLLIPLTIILPFSWYAIRDYVDKLIEYEVFNDGLKNE